MSERGSTLDGRVALVTGASGLIGRATARLLQQRGAAVVVTAAAPGDFDRASALGGDGAEFSEVVADLRDRADCERLVDAVLERHGRLDLLVNAAEVVADHPAEDLPLDRWREVLAVNLTAVFVLCQRAGRTMLDGDGGTIVNLTALADDSGDVAYRATKDGLVGLTRVLGTEWAGRGVRVVAVAPGRVAEGGTGGVSPDEVARVIGYVCSPEASFLTASQIVVGGGRAGRST